MFSVFRFVFALTFLSLLQLGKTGCSALDSSVSKSDFKEKLGLKYNQEECDAKFQAYLDANKITEENFVGEFAKKKKGKSFDAKVFKAFLHQSKYAEAFFECPVEIRSQWIIMKEECPDELFKQYLITLKRSPVENFLVDYFWYHVLKAYDMIPIEYVPLMLEGIDVKSLHTNFTSSGLLLTEAQAAWFRDKLFPHLQKTLQMDEKNKDLYTYWTYLAKIGRVDVVPIVLNRLKQKEKPEIKRLVDEQDDVDQKAFKISQKNFAGDLPSFLNMLSRNQPKPIEIIRVLKRLMFLELGEYVQLLASYCNNQAIRKNFLKFLPLSATEAEMDDILLNLKIQGNGVDILLIETETFQQTNQFVKEAKKDNFDILSTLPCISPLAFCQFFLASSNRKVILKKLSRERVEYLTAVFYPDLPILSRLFDTDPDPENPAKPLYKLSEIIPSAVYAEMLEVFYETFWPEFMSSMSELSIPEVLSLLILDYLSGKTSKPPNID